MNLKKELKIFIIGHKPLVLGGNVVRGRFGVPKK